MGACTSKPKTAEFEGALLNLQTDEPQDEPMRKSLDDTRKGGAASLKSLEGEQKFPLKCGLQLEECCDAWEMSLEPEEKPSKDMNVVEKKNGEKVGIIDSQTQSIVESKIDPDTINVVKGSAEAQEFHGKHDPSMRNSMEELQQGLMSTKTVGEGFAHEVEREKPGNQQSTVEEQIFEDKEPEIDAVSGCIEEANRVEGVNLMRYATEPDKAVNGAQGHEFDETSKKRSAIIRKTRDSEWTTLDFSGMSATDGKTFQGFGGPRIAEVDSKTRDSEWTTLDFSGMSAIDGGKTLQGLGGPRIAEVDESPLMDTLAHVLKFTSNDQMQGQAVVKEGALKPNTEPHIVEVVQAMGKTFGQPTDGIVVRDLGTEVSNINSAPTVPMSNKHVFKANGTYAPNDELSVAEALTLQERSSSGIQKDTMSVVSCSATGATSKLESDLFCGSTLIKAPQVSKEQVIPPESHIASPRSSNVKENGSLLDVQWTEACKVEEPEKPICGKEKIPDIDEVWEKLASEFERQESLSSLSA